VIFLNSRRTLAASSGVPIVEADDQLSYIGFGPFLWHAQLMIELNMDTVLAAVNDLHASTGNRIFTLIEIAEAIDGQRVTPPPGMRVTIDEDGNPHPELNPPVPRWVTTLNNILLRLGEEGKLPVEPIAMVAFPPLPPE
jgi:hypothetical protein